MASVGKQQTSIIVSCTGPFHFSKISHSGKSHWTFCFQRSLKFVLTYTEHYIGQGQKKMAYYGAYKGWKNSQVPVSPETRGLLIAVQLLADSSLVSTFLLWHCAIFLWREIAVFRNVLSFLLSPFLANKSLDGDYEIPIQIFIL